MPFYDVGSEGYWNAAANRPIIKSGRGENGWAYQVAVAGTTEIDGVTDWRVGDIILFMNDTWVRLPGRETIGVYGNPSSAIEFVIDGGGVITTGDKGNLLVPFNCEIVSWTLLSAPSGSITFDIRKGTFAQFPFSSLAHLNSKYTIRSSSFDYRRNSNQ